MKRTIIVLAIFVLLVVLVTIFASFVTINAGERGVLLTFGKVEDKVFEPGLHAITPFVNSVVLMDVRTQKDEVDASAASKDLQVVSTKVALNYHVDPNYAGRIYQNIGKEYKQRIIDPAIQEAVKSSTAKYTAEELITKRETVKELIKSELKTRLAVYNILVDEISITNFDFSPDFNRAIEAKVTAEQQAQKAKNDLERIKIEAEQKIAESKGQAEAIIIKAKAEAEAITITGNALKQNQQLVKLEAVKKWDGVLPKQLLGTAPLPFIDVKAIEDVV